MAECGDFAESDLQNFLSNTKILLAFKITFKFAKNDPKWTVKILSEILFINTITLMID